MHSFALTALLLTSCLSTIARAIPEQGTVALKIRKDVIPRPLHSDSSLHKRLDSAFTAHLDNLRYGYTVNISIGTPPQSVRVHLDTGSSDLWIPSSNGNICSSNLNCHRGSFKESASSTFKLNKEISGPYFNDSLNIDDVHLTDVTMGLAQSGFSFLGLEAIMGIGFKEGEAANYPSLTPVPFTYPTVLDNLLKQGLILSRSYSLWLDNLLDNTGVILFGGIDHEKYKQPLVSLPIEVNPDTNRRDAMYVSWTGLTVNKGTEMKITSSHDVSPSEPRPALLDSGASITYLPEETADAIYAYIGAVQSTQGFAMVPCNIDKDYTFTFTLGGDAGAEITVSIYELILPVQGDKDQCQFLIGKAGPRRPVVLGDTFLRSAYVVYDLDNYKIALAQTNFNATTTADGDRIVPMTGTGIPKAVPSHPRSGAASTQSLQFGLAAITITACLLLAAI